MQAPLPKPQLLYLYPKKLVIEQNKVQLPQPLHPRLPLNHRQLIQRKRPLLLNQLRQLRRVAGEPDLRVAAGLGD